ncbi:MAG: MFS transporter [Spirochaetia bacterium]|nr:MFS transporter [Spirochaetia bacterium]
MKSSRPRPVLFFTIFIDLLGFGILIPVLPLLLASPASPYYLLQGTSFTPAQGYILYGFLIATFPIFQFISTPVLGQLSDRYGRKSLLVVSILGGGISYVIFAVGILLHSLPLLFISRAFQGITGGNIAIAQATIADITTPENRSKNFGLIGAAFGLGFIIGPYLGGRLSDPHFVSWFTAATPFWFAAILCLLNAFWVMLVLPETHLTRGAAKAIDWVRSLSNIFRAFKMAELRVLFATGFLYQAGFAFFTTFFSVYLIHKFQFTQGRIGDFYAWVGIWIAFSQAVIMRFVANRFKESTVVRFGTILTGLLIMAYLLPDKAWMLYVIVPFFAIFNGVSFATTSGLVSRAVSPTQQGEVLGINTSVQALAQAIPPILSGYIAAKIQPQAPVFISAVVIILAGLVFNIFFRNPKKSS